MASPEASAGRRSDPARGRILDAARSRFAREGFEGATIRAIAADARIDPSLVMRYYGNKDALFAAAVDVELELPDLTEVPQRSWGNRIATYFFQRWESNPSEGALGLLVRTAATNDHAAARLREVVDRQITAALEGAGIGEAPRRAALIATQMLGLAYCRYVIGLAEIASASPDELIAPLATTIQRYLTMKLDPTS